MTNEVARMRVLTWNCNGALRRKFDYVAAFNADLLVIQECEDPARTVHSEYRAFAHNHIWAGPTKNKGIAVFARDGVKLDKVELSLEPLELFLPIMVNEHWPLLACWTRHANSPNFRYVGQLWKFLQAHKAFLEHPASVVIGDLNSNTRWDEWDRWWNHSDVVNELEAIGLKSAYHQHFGEAQGSETRPTLFHTRNIGKPYHIDYGFFGASWHVEDVCVGSPTDWIGISDHMPIVIDAALTHTPRPVLRLK